MTLFEWDNETLAPKEAGQLTSKVIGILSGEYFGVVNQDKVKELAKACREDPGLTQAEKAQVRELSEELEKLGCIPREEYQEFARLASESARVWAKAKEKDDFDEFAPMLEKVIGFQKKFAGYRAKDGQKKYDVMLNDYEPGFSMEVLDEFFGAVKQEIVPLLTAVKNSGVMVRDDFLTGEFTDEQQERIGHQRPSLYHEPSQ